MAKKTLKLDEVKKVAKLANLPLTDKEARIYTDQLSEILAAFTKLSSVQTDNIDPTFNPIQNENIMRADQTRSALSQYQALKNAPSAQNGLFVTKGVLSEE